jgi:DNA segregation ATPase FtsK/SpoIIIE, S-DNA-T family
MALAHPKDTDERAVPAAVRRFFRNRLLETAGLVLIAGAGALALSLASWSPMDAAFAPDPAGPSSNYLGPAGAHVADGLIRAFGLAAILAFAIPMAWGATLLSHQAPKRIFRRLLNGAMGMLGACALLSFLSAFNLAPLTEGPGGSAGRFLADLLTSFLGLGLKAGFAAVLAGVIFAGLAISGSLRAAGFDDWRSRLTATVLGERAHDLIESTYGWIAHGLISLRQSWRKSPPPAQRSGRRKTLKAEAPDTSFWSFLWHGNKTDARVEPRLSGSGAVLREPRLISTARANQPELEDETDEDGEAASSLRVTRTAKAIKPGKRAQADAQPSFFPSRDEFDLPPLPLLAEPKHAGRGNDLSDEALEQNARMLEGVLDDFGVRGEITKVHPGPVVTLYELEPAPGIKSSRVIGLADDIARSMSAVSARVAVVPGRNAIGIELPNLKRETVYLRELLAAEAFEKSNQSLCLALGKNIGGEPVYADLARMPHLLIAGTTGSGKSVGINTMILSLLYRLPPDACRLIMIDPKMLELSVYEGIPHLLAPVVTDPRKAVVALKWAVREMEDRYRKMSKLGVRNIDGYNAKLRQSQAKGEPMSRTVQTGYDAETGQPMFETEQIDMKPMPFIVVIIDEMADLMMVAGKDIEGAVQRLAQMARAAGIHVIMATQRPSVDVITGTIKANFPTRVSFQVTSKIDSRTILGEQGAEQLLGQGDMLYMAGGGRISRLHSPFVTDEEVEKIVRHLKAQGVPEYIEAVTEEPDEEFGGEMDMEGAGSGDALYDQAVAVVLRDRKVSTSYIQRRLQIGYNKAASLIERMEQEGLISSSSATGKREILAGGEAA